jgi:hypothetical protein
MKTYQEVIEKFGTQLPSWFDEDYYKGITFNLSHLRNKSKTKKINEACYFLEVCSDDIKKKSEPMTKKLANEIVKFIGDFQPVPVVKKYQVTAEETIEVKRFHFPLIIELKCPTCGTLCKHDFIHDYLSYPALNVPETIGVFCYNESCNKYFDVDITLRISLEVDESTIKVQD